MSRQRPDAAGVDTHRDMPKHQANQAFSTDPTARAAALPIELSVLNLTGGPLLVTASYVETVRAVMSQSTWRFRTRGSVLDERLVARDCRGGAGIGMGRRLRAGW